jgi:hypothetical protein
VLALKILRSSERKENIHTYSESCRPFPQNLLPCCKTMSVSYICMKNPISQALLPLALIHANIHMHSNSYSLVACNKVYEKLSSMRSVQCIIYFTCECVCFCVYICAGEACDFILCLVADRRMLTCIHFAPSSVSRAALFLVLQRGERDATVV